jgi:hypothetical protein
MVASSAFKELSAVLARLEAAGTEVQHAAVDEDLTSTDGSVTADLSVGVPVLSDADASEAVSIEAVDATVADGQVTVDLAVTVSGDDATATDTLTLGLPGSGEAGTTDSVPAYKDPEALRAVYERYETFPEMTEALDVDVTSETVRRHMVKYDIHDPADSTPQYGDAAAAESTRDDGTSERARADTGSDAEPAAEDAESTASRTEATSESDPVTGSAVTDGGNATVAEPRERDRPPAPSPVTDVLAEASPDAGATAGGFDLPESVTVGDLTDAVNGARTVRELARELGVRQSVAREFLKEFDLIHFVSHPLAANQVTVSPDEVRRRLGPPGQ